MSEKTSQFALDFRADAKRDIDRLAPIARELAQKAGRHGITVSNIRIVGQARGILTGGETGRRLSFLCRVPEAAGLVKTGQFRRSDVRRAKANLNAVWVLPEHLQQERSA